MPNAPAPHVPLRIPDTDFTLVSEFVTVDKQRRIRIPVKDLANSYAIHINAVGQIVLDPVRVVSLLDMSAIERRASK